jgi:hypothetical protein
MMIRGEHYHIAFRIGAVVCMASIAACGSSSSSATAPSNLPVLSSGLPSGMLLAGTKEVVLQVRTDKAGDTCKYSAQANTAYSAMVSAFVTNGVDHVATMAGLVDTSVYNRYVRCDRNGQSNSSDLIISFSVGTSAPIGRISGSFVPTVGVGQAITGDLVLDGQTMVGALNNGNFSLDGVTAGTHKLRATRPDGTVFYDRVLSIDVTALADNRFAAFAVAARYTADIMTRIDVMSRNGQQYLGEAPGIPGGTARPVEPGSLVYDARPVAGQTPQSRAVQVQAMKFLFTWLVTNIPLYENLTMVYVCDGSSKPPDVDRCDTPELPAFGSDNTYIVTIDGGAAKTTHASYVRNNVSVGGATYRNVVRSGTVMMTKEQGAAGLYRQTLEALIGFYTDWPDSGAAADSIFNGNLQSTQPTVLDDAIVKTHLGMSPGSLSPFDDSSVVVYAPASTIPTSASSRRLGPAATGVLLSPYSVEQVREAEKSSGVQSPSPAAPPTIGPRIGRGFGARGGGL